eukprot:TRINITY_DN2633_c0_g1_i1.p1 TRINITY_DN2633_c0_g1~~TRINITY_DN2633_c0_g1_i1.p1  ORF type:complete len:293 (+),score=58.27 TRINITY_DN2633_c0_g1_i1:198-1076(+)
MFKISPAERSFLEDGVKQDLRADGRTRVNYRHFSLETGIVSQANGSARLKLSNTDILIGVKVEIGVPEPRTPSQGKIFFSVECCPFAAPEFESKGAEYLNVELARLLERTCASTCDLPALCLVPGVHCWVVYVDVLVLDSGGNLFDAISIASRAALHNTMIPKVTVMPGEGLGQWDIEPSDDPQDVVPFSVEDVPVCITLTKVAGEFIVDSTIDEELCMEARLTVAVNLQGKVCSIQKGGPGGLSPDTVSNMLETAKELGRNILDKQDEALKREDMLRQSSTTNEPIGFFSA